MDVRPVFKRREGGGTCIIITVTVAYPVRYSGGVSTCRARNFNANYIINVVVSDGHRTSEGFAVPRPALFKSAVKIIENKLTQIPW